jgi:hypothetical protein
MSTSPSTELFTEYSVKGDSFGDISKLSTELPMALYPFMYYSGSLVLKAILEDLDKQAQASRFGSADIDIYVDMTHESFNIVELDNYLYSLHRRCEFGFRITGEDTSSVDSLFPDMSKKDKSLFFYRKSIANVCQYAELLRAGENPTDGLQPEDSIAANYMAAKYIVDVISYTTTKNCRKIDIILLCGSIESHLTEDYDLDVCKNYVDHAGDVFVNNISGIDQGIAVVDMNVFQKNIGRSLNGTKKYFERMAKYKCRGFDIRVVRYVPSAEVSYSMDFTDRMYIEVLQLACTLLSTKKQQVLYIKGVGFFNASHMSKMDTTEVQSIWKTVSAEIHSRMAGYLEMKAFMPLIDMHVVTTHELK